MLGCYHRSMNLDEEIKKAATEMHDAEDALISQGFSAEQWMSMKQYILAAIVHNTVTIAKGLQNFPSGVTVTED